MFVQTLTKNKSVMMAATMALMLVSFILALFDIEAILNIVFTLFALFSSTRADSTLWGSGITMLLGLGALAFIVITFEYHVKHAGEPSSRKLMAISLGVQSLLALIGLVIL